MLGSNSASNSRNNEIYRLSQFKMTDYIRKSYLFVKKMQCSLISITLGIPSDVGQYFN